MSRIPWTTYDGEDVERVIAVMLCSENPSVVAVRPGRGDGGLDVIVPSGNGAHDVYQVKKFAENLTKSQKKQIQKSFARVLESVEAGQIKVTNWYLTMPLNPTPGNRTWFDEMTADAPFSCEWRGLVFCERLVTDHENVVDYYLRDGKDRLAAAMADALTLVKSKDAPESNGLLPPQHLGGALVASARLVDTDPNYQFGFRLLPHEPRLDHAPPGAVFTQAQQEPEIGMWLCIDVYPRSPLALMLDPIVIDVQVIVSDPESPLATDLADFSRYGKPFSAPLGTANIQARLPGGMGGPMTGAAIRLLDVAEGEERRVRLVLGNEARDVLAQVNVLLSRPTAGLDGAGFYAKGREENGAFEIELKGRLDDRTLNFAVTRLPVDGRVAVEIDDGVQFFQRMRSAHAFALLPHVVGPIPETAWTPMPDGSLGGSTHEDVESTLIADLIHALSLLQTRVTFPVKVPDLAEVSVRNAREIIGLSRLIGGSVVALHNQPFWLCGKEVDPPKQDRFAYKVEQQMIFRWDGHEADLGVIYVVGWNLTAETATREGHEGHDDFRVVPVDDSKWLASFDEGALLSTAPGLTEPHEG